MDDSSPLNFETPYSKGYLCPVTQRQPGRIFLERWQMHFEVLRLLLLCSVYAAESHISENHATIIISSSALPTRSPRQGQVWPVWSRSLTRGSKSAFAEAKKESNCSSCTACYLLPLSPTFSDIDNRHHNHTALSHSDGGGDQNSEEVVGPL